MWPAVLRHYQLGRNTVLTCIMLLFWFLRCCSRKSTHWGFRSFWFSLLVSALNWLGLKMFCRPLMCLISSKVGKCPASDWWVFGTCSDLLLCWDGEGSYTGIGSSFPCVTRLLLASHWLFALKFIKRREGKSSKKSRPEVFQLILYWGWNLKFQNRQVCTSCFLFSPCLVALHGLLCFLRFSPGAKIQLNRWVKYEQSVLEDGSFCGVFSES